MPHTISLRLKDGAFEKLGELSKELDRSKSYIVKKALNQYFENYADYQIALDRLKDKDDKIISAEDMRSRLGL